MNSQPFNLEAALAEAPNPWYEMELAALRWHQKSQREVLSLGWEHAPEQKAWFLRERMSGVVLAYVHPVAHLWYAGGESQSPDWQYAVLGKPPVPTRAINNLPEACLAAERDLKAHLTREPSIERSTLD